MPFPFMNLQQKRKGINQLDTLKILPSFAIR